MLWPLSLNTLRCTWFDAELSGINRGLDTMKSCAGYAKIIAVILKRGSNYFNDSRERPEALMGF
ncbi:MAG: hypothetical protein QME41_03245 [Actinomycetota bacterium]|nr:hypothetical protein [Actinomycetota bacterium]